VRSVIAEQSLTKARPQTAPFFFARATDHESRGTNHVF